MLREKSVGDKRSALFEVQIFTFKGPSLMFVFELVRIERHRPHGPCLRSSETHQLADFTINEIISHCKNT